MPRNSRESWNPLNKRLPRLFLLLLTAITLFHIVLLLDSFSLRHRDYFSRCRFLGIGPYGSPALAYVVSGVTESPAILPS